MSHHIRPRRGRNHLRKINSLFEQLENRRLLASDAANVFATFDGTIAQSNGTDQIKIDLTSGNFNLPNGRIIVGFELEAANGSLLFQPPFQNRAPSSMDGLQAGSRLLTALDAQPIAPHIAYHSIIANIRRDASPDQMSDGFVKYTSAHLEGAASECVVNASHLCEADPEVIAEVRRILQVHIGETTGTPRPSEQPTSQR